MTNTTEAALREIENRVSAVANLWHNSEQWHSEDAADIVAGAEGTAWDWIFQDVRTALSQPSPASSTEERDAAINAVAKIEMDREGYPLSRTQEEIYADAAEMVDAVLSLSQPSPASSTAGEAEQAAWAWLERRSAEHPNDVTAYGTDDMVDAFMAGAASYQRVLATFANDLEMADFPNVGSALNERMCCNGHMCGCRGASVGEYLAHELRSLSPLSGEPASVAVACSRCGNPDMMMCDCSLPSRVSKPTPPSVAGEELRREAVRAICRQQADNPSQHVCKCMEEGGVGFGKFPGALLCRDTYEEIWDALQPVLASALSKPTPVEAKPWYKTDAHRDLSRIIPDMEGKIADAKTRYAHCLPDHLFAPLEASITELRVLRHEVAAQPTPVEAGLREAAIRVRDNNRRGVTGAEARLAWSALNAALSETLPGQEGS